MGPIVKVDPTSEVAVTSYLQQARDWLATAVESTGPEQIAAAKAEIATAAEATKQLGLSKEIQHDATEMVRRAEWALAKSVRLAQDRGEVKREREGGGRPATGTAIGTSKPSASDLYGSNSKAQTTRMHALADVEEGELDEALAQARQEGNLSRANVVRKIKNQGEGNQSGDADDPACSWPVTAPRHENVRRSSSDDSRTRPPSGPHSARHGLGLRSGG